MAANAINSFLLGQFRLFYREMNLLVNAIAATAFAASGALLGYSFPRLPKSCCIVGYFIPLALILVDGVAIHYPVLSFKPPLAPFFIETFSTFEAS